MSSDRSDPLRVAVIGGGVSGLSAAWLLAKTCDVTLYEAEPRLGGHCDTFDWDGAPVDCGFIVYNERTYPNLTALFAHLGVPTRASNMSFAVSIDEGLLEYSGSGLRGLVAQRANLLWPRYWSMLSDMLRFFREARKDVGREDLGALETYLHRRGYAWAFRNCYLYPMAAAVWSTTARWSRPFVPPARRAWWALTVVSRSSNSSTVTPRSWSRAANAAASSSAARAAGPRVPSSDSG